MRVGSLFSGYGGLEMGIEAVLPAETAWHVEFDAAPSRILAHHWPSVPNYGDITTVNWSQVEPVDVLAGGFPCQDVSLAGLRKGLHPDTRSGLWSHFALAIDALRPSLVIVENVRGLLSAQAASNLEPDAWDLGDRNVRPPLRALGAVLGDLADLGYDASWRGVRAADAGAPHGRFRVFLLAHPADPDGSGAAPRPELRQPGEGGHHTPDLGDSTDADADGERHGRREDPRMVGRLDRDHESETLQRERPRALTRDRGAAPAEDANIATRGQRRQPAPRQTPAGRPRPDTRRRDRAWGVYEPAITRWEHVTRRLAPAPTETSKLGGDRLSPAFVEWMMGLPAGHVTDPTIGLTRNEQLKALGNGVVPQQAALALTRLLSPARLPGTPRDSATVPA